MKKFKAFLKKLLVSSLTFSLCISFLPVASARHGGGHTTHGGGHIRILTHISKTGTKTYTDKHI